ncbi:MAG: alginate export family protein, partial [Akkermansiaceae bacterium]
MLKTLREHGRSGLESGLLTKNLLASLLAGICTSGVAMASTTSGQISTISPMAIGAKPSPEIPKYVSSLEDWGARYNFSDSVEGNDWLLLGLQYRNRVENFDNFYRVPSLPSDGGYFSRTWFYLGIRDILDPFRFTVELEDSRREGFDFPFSARQENHTDFLQAYVELYLDEGLFGRTTSLQAGRFTIDAVDRRLVARNRFRNSANTFDGVRLRIGDDKSPWVANFFATRPVEALEGSFDDRSRDEREFYGAYATFRSNSPALVFEPYYFYLDDQRFSGRERQLHTAGAHAYGLICDEFFDYDVTASLQWGEINGLDHFAYFFHAELGHTFDHPWKPRVSGWLNYGSGDDDPNDNDSGRFTELFGAPFGLYGFTRYFTSENTINPSLSFSIKPVEDVKVELYLRSYSLASDNDAWVRGGRRDVTGKSGRHIGEEIDLRVRWQATDCLLFNTGLAHFIPGSFVDETGLSENSTLVYLQGTF